MPHFAELGHTRLYTIRERRRRGAAIALALLGALAATWLAAATSAWLAGHGFTFPHLEVRPFIASEQDGNDGGLLGLPRAGETPSQPGRPQFPIAIRWPSSPLWTAILAVPLWLAWLRLLVHPMLAGLRRETRHRGLAPPTKIRAELGARAVRRAGRFTLPATPWSTRLFLPTTAFGFGLGQLLHARRIRLWANWEQRIRIIARPGWGKTARLLVPIIRDLPGPALVSSTEPSIFKQTVTSRSSRRRRLRWRWLTLLLRPVLPLTQYPIAVVDFSAPDNRFAAGYDRVRWNAIVGCENFTIAHRRAVALVSGLESESHNDRGNDRDRFFRNSAAEVLAAWLHAAALGDKEIPDLLKWRQKTSDPMPTRILSDDPRAEPSALINIRTHLDSKAGTTTSGVERYLTLAMNSLASAEGRALCGYRFNPATGDPTPTFDMVEFIRSGGTVYLLAEPGRIERTRPLLSMFAAEMFLAAETAALRTRRERLPEPYIAVLDELRYGITVPNLPYVALALRKFGIGYVYAVQSSSQEDALYGHDAPALRAAAGVSIVGGIDIDSARELSDRAGTTPVVTATRGTRERSEHIQHQPTLTIADQQRLADGEATFIVRGLSPFLAWVPSIYEQRRLLRRIRREESGVARRVHIARLRERAAYRARTTAQAVGADFAPEGPTR